MADPLLVEDGVLGNGETYKIIRSRPYNPADEYPYTLHYGDGEVMIFGSMKHAQYFMDGYAIGKGTFIKTRDRVNA